MSLRILMLCWALQFSMRHLLSYFGCDNLIPQVIHIDGPNKLLFLTVSVICIGQILISVPEVCAAILVCVTLVRHGDISLANSHPFYSAFHQMVFCFFLSSQQSFHRWHIMWILQRKKEAADIVISSVELVEMSVPFHGWIFRTDVPSRPVWQERDWVFVAPTAELNTVPTLTESTLLHKSGIAPPKLNESGLNATDSE